MKVPQLKSFRRIKTIYCECRRFHFYREHRASERMDGINSHHHMFIRLNNFESHSRVPLSIKRNLLIRGVTWEREFNYLSSIWLRLSSSLGVTVFCCFDGLWAQWTSQSSFERKRLLFLSLGNRLGVCRLFGSQVRSQVEQTGRASWVS